MTHNYLFFRSSGLLYRYKVRIAQNGKISFEILRYSGDAEERNYDNIKDFWTDWEKDARYVDEDTVDFAFLSDEKDYKWKRPQKYSMCKPTEVFSLDLIRSFVDTKLSAGNITLIELGCPINLQDSKAAKIIWAAIPYPRKEEEKPAHTDTATSNPVINTPAKTPNKDERFKQIDLAAAYVKRAGDSLKSSFHDLEAGNSEWFKKLRPDMSELIAALDKAHDNLTHPCLKIAFVGTTSSGKSTLLNGLSGTRIAPMEAGEMSAGVVRIKNAQKISFVVRPTEHMAWSAGEYAVKNENDIYNALRDPEKGIMNLYRRAAKENHAVKAPEIEITAPLAPKNGGILDFNMPEGIDLEFYDLPGIKTVTDSLNLSVIQRHLADSFLLVVLNYSDTDSDKRDGLLKEIKKIVHTICRNNDALLFVLNRIDERNSDDDPLESRVKSLQADIKAGLELHNTPVIIPMSALPLYHLQTAWGTGSGPDFSAGLDEKSKKQMQMFFEDCGKVRTFLGKEDPDKKAWFKENDEDNIDDWAKKDMRQLLKWVYGYSGAYKFWKAMESKLEEQIGAIIINPALEGTPVLLDGFAGKLDAVVHALGKETKEEIQNEKNKVEALARDVKKNIAVFKDGFIKDFKESIDALKKSDFTRFYKHRQFDEMAGVLREITDDVHETIMVPIRNTLLKSDGDALDELEEKLAKVIPRQLATDIRRMTNQLLLKGYGRYAEKGHTFQCRVDEKSSKEGEIRELQEIDKRRMDLAGYVDQALLSRSKLLLQENLLFFQGVTQNIIQESMESLTKNISEMTGFDNKAIPVPVSRGTEDIDLPLNVFSKITIEKASQNIKKIVKEQY